MCRFLGRRLLGHCFLGRRFLDTLNQGASGMIDFLNTALNLILLVCISLHSVVWRKSCFDFLPLGLRGCSDTSNSSTRAHQVL